jgi:hypothetical protein
MERKATFVRLQWIGIFLLPLLFVTCKGPQGDVGPQGTPGPQGTQGAQGPVGPAGSVTLSASPWVKITDTMWVVNQDSTYFLVSREDANITQPVLEKGLVMAYYRNVGRESVVFSIPSVTNELALGFFMRVLNNRGTMNFDMSFFEPRKTPIDFDLEFRWIIVPPNPGGRLKTLDWSNYELVRQELGLSE